MHVTFSALLDLGFHSQWLFICDWTCTCTGYSSGTKNVGLILREIKEKASNNEGV